MKAKSTTRAKKRTARTRTKKSVTVGAKKRRRKAAAAPKKAAKQAKAASKPVRKRRAKKATKVAPAKVTKKKVTRKATKKTAKKQTAMKVVKKTTKKRRTKKAVATVAKKRVMKKRTRKTTKRTAKKTVSGVKKVAKKRRATKRKVKKVKKVKTVGATPKARKPRRRKRVAKKTISTKTAKKRTVKKAVRRTAKKRVTKVAKKRTRKTAKKRVTKKTVRRTKQTTKRRKRTYLKKRRPAILLRGRTLGTVKDRSKTLATGAVGVTAGLLTPNLGLQGLVAILDALTTDVGTKVQGFLDEQKPLVRALESAAVAYSAQVLRGKGQSFSKNYLDGLTVSFAIKAIKCIVEAITPGNKFSSYLNDQLTVGGSTVGYWPVLSADELYARKAEIDGQIASAQADLADVDYSLLSLDQQAIYESISSHCAEASSWSDLVRVALDSGNIAKATGAWQDARMHLAIAQSMLAGLLVSPVVGPLEQQAMVQQYQQQLAQEPFGQQQFLQQQYLQQVPQQQLLQQQLPAQQQFFQPGQEQQQFYTSQQALLAQPAQQQFPLQQQFLQQKSQQLQMTPGMFPQQQVAGQQMNLGQNPPNLTINGIEVGPAPDPASVVQESKTVGGYFLNMDQLMLWSDFLARQTGHTQNDIMTAYLIRFISNNGKNWRFGPHQVTASTVSGQNPGQNTVAGYLAQGELPVMWTDTVGSLRVAGCQTDECSVRDMVGTLLGHSVGTWSHANLTPHMNYGPYSPGLSTYRTAMEIAGQ